MGSVRANYRIDISRVLIAVVCFAVVVALGFARRWSGIEELDRVVAEWMPNLRFDVGNDLARGVAWVFEPRHVVPVVVLGALALGLARRPLLGLAARLAMAAVLYAAINPNMKQAFEAPRPDADLQIGHALGYGYPSGHTAGVFALVFTIVLSVRDRTIRAAALAIGVLVAFDRLYLDAHYFTDVIGGTFVALTAALVATSVTHRAASEE